MTTKFRIGIDRDNNTDEFWNALRGAVARNDHPLLAEPLLKIVSDEELLVDADQRDQIISCLKRLPGWPGVAPHPVTIHEVT